MTDNIENNRRELELEATIATLYKIIEKMQETVPMAIFGDLPELAIQIFNNAEIRADINDYFKINIEWESEND